MNASFTRHLMAALCPLAIGAGLANAAGGSSQTICTHPSEQFRTVSVLYQDASELVPCAVVYQKLGVDEEVASAKNQAGYCEAKERKLVRNLVKSGWECEHDFTGALSTPDRSLRLDLFSKPAIQAEREVTVIDLGSANIEANALRSTLEKTAEADYQAQLDAEYGKQLADRLMRELEVQYGDEYAISATVSFKVGVILSDLPATIGDDLTEAHDPEKTGGQTLLATTEIATTVADSEHLLLQSDDLPQSEQFAAISSSLPTKQEAHRFAAEFRRVYPNVTTRVSEGQQGGNDWRVVLGSNADRNALEVGIGNLDPKTKQYFSIVSLTEPDSLMNQLEYVPDDWTRYVIAGCYADGNNNSEDLAQCSGFLLETDDFLSCMGGGVCAPDYFDGKVSSEQVDFLTVIGSDDPIAEARTRLVNKVEGCERIEGTSSDEFAECAALAMLGNEQRELYQCHQRSSSGVNLLKCVGSESLNDDLLLYERCAIDGYAASECLLDNLDSEYLSNSARCVNYEEPDEILTCALDANLDIDQSIVLSCIQYSSDASVRATCLAREYLDDNQAALYECSQLSKSVSDFGLCTAERNGSLSRDEILAAQCLLDGNERSSDLLNCAGGAVGGAELARCLETGLNDPACFGAEPLVSQMANDQLEVMIVAEQFDNEIALYRQNLFAAEGGDLPYILSNPVASSLFAAAAVVGTTVKKKSKGFLNKLGFGKK